MATREEKLKSLLEPISWHPSSSIGSRQRLVTERRNEVRTAFPFMSDEEKAKAKEWLAAEKHEGLWD
jgi:hypothetical protein